MRAKPCRSLLINKWIDKERLGTIFEIIPKRGKCTLQALFIMSKLYGKILIDGQLIEAQKKNELVIFAGAGVSYGPPANVPSLDKVAQDFLETHVSKWMPVLDKQGKLIDLIDRLNEIDRLKPKLFRPFIKSAYSSHVKPCKLHNYLVRLFKVNQHLRIITTNYDTLFEKAATDLRGFEPLIFNYPDLAKTVSATVPSTSSSANVHPDASPGTISNVNGIFHIHGSCSSNSQDLVLTRDDFQKAYLKPNSSAATFLKLIPDHFYLLFLGLSGNDPIVLDFISANCNKIRTFAICPVYQAEAWDNLDINTIPYPIENAPNKHTSLSLSIKEWASDSQEVVTTSAQLASGEE